MAVTSRETHLARRPSGAPVPDDFRLVEASLGDPGPGEVLVRNDAMSVEPYMRGRMNDAKSYVPPFRLDAVMEGSAVGEVVASNDPSLPVGAVVLSMLGWREYALAPASAFQRIDGAAGLPRTAFLGVLGVPGMTAWVGLHEIAGVKAGDVVYVSSAAGAVGIVAGQLAKAMGARVVGSAGGPAKAAMLTEKFGYDDAFDYRGEGGVRAGLKRVAPGGIDVYFENVGGEHLEAAIDALRPFGRVAACGMISQYNDRETSGPRNIIQVIPKRLTIRGFIVSDWMEKRGAFLADVGPALASGKIVGHDTVFDGIERATEALTALLAGDENNVGKILVALR